MAYDTDAQAWFTAVSGLGTGFTTPWQNAANQLILDLKAASIFSKLTGLYLFNVESLGQEIINAVSPSNYALSAHGTLTLTAETGIVGNGTNGYYDTNFPFTSANPFSVGALVTAAGASASLAGDLANASMVCDIIPSNGGTTAVIRLGMSNSISWANAVATGHFAVTRSGGTVVGYQNGVQKATASATNFGLTGDNLLWMRRNNVYNTFQYGAAWFAQAALTGTEVAALDTALDTFLAAVLSPTAFDPSQLSGLLAWFDAQDAATITQSGGDASQWNDKSGNGLNLGPVSGTDTATYIATAINGHPALSTTNLTFDFQTPTTLPITSVTDLTIIAFVESDPGGWHNFEYAANIGESPGFVVPMLQFQQMVLTTSQGNIFGSTTFANNTPYCLVWQKTGATAQFRVNGVDESMSGSYSGATETVSNNFGVLNFGFNTFSGRMGEIAIYNRALTPTEVTTLEAYFTAKWGADPNLASSPAARATVTAALKVGARLAAAPTARAAITATLVGNGAMAAAVSAQATVAGALKVGARLAAAPTARASITAPLTTSIKLAAAPTARASVTASLTTNIKLAAAPTARASITAPLTTSIKLAAAPSASAAVTATLSSLGAQLQSAVVAQPNMVGSLSTRAVMLLDAGTFGLIGQDALLSKSLRLPASAASFAMAPQNTRLYKSSFLSPADESTVVRSEERAVIVPLEYRAAVAPPEARSVVVPEKIERLV